MRLFGTNGMRRRADVGTSVLTVATCAALAALTGMAGLGFYSAFGFYEQHQVSIGRAAVAERGEVDSDAKPLTTTNARRVRLGARGDETVQPDGLSEADVPDQEPKATRQPIRRGAPPHGHGHGAVEPADHEGRGGHGSHHRAKSTKPKHVETYATACVRLCDGAFFPLSHAARVEQLDDEADRCASSCGSPARLYYTTTPVADATSSSDDAAGAMRDFAGNKYADLPTAFRFRHGKAPSCACHAQPWQAAAVERHENFALERAASRGDVVSARVLALRRAVHNLRHAGPAEERVAFGHADWQLPPPRADRLVFGPQVVAPLDENEAKSIPPPKYLGELKPLAVVLDATGHTAVRKPPRAPQSVAMISVVGEPERIALTTGSIEGASSAAQGSTKEAARAQGEPEAVSPRSHSISIANVANGKSRKASSRLHAAVAKQKAGNARASVDKTSGAARAERTYRRVAHAEPDWRELIFRPY